MWCLAKHFSGGPEKKKEQPDLKEIKDQMKEKIIEIRSSKKESQDFDNPRDKSMTRPKSLDDRC